MVGTLQLRKPSELRIVVARLVVPIVLLVVAGAVIGGFVAFHDDATATTVAAIDTARATQPAPAAAAPAASAPAATAEALSPVAAEPPPTPDPSAPSPAAVEPPTASDSAAPSMVAAEPPTAADPAAPSTEPIAEPARPPPPVEVRIDSTPSGATVTLVDRGKSQFVGTTPVNAAVDPSRKYDLVFSYENRPPQHEHLDPRTTRRIVAVLGKRAPAVRPADSVPRHLDRSEPGEGTLMVSSKPPCEIVIDGKPTGLITPQRAITLLAGNHKITLINRENDVRRTIAVQITASATEKLIEDLMK